ncbi:uncharacterized protein LOC131939898 [Physella acuta]|uniref:uncharacterized protein LOC131939898 n=1 Tax=Physella acuta TaxID=109671 RepID=UPI0027DE0DD4|nr:uncharacterized protein LOC131939898 [Physella acuta]
MAVIKTPAAIKTVHDKPSLMSFSIPSSPAISDASSQDSRSVLIPVITQVKDDGKPKKKKLFVQAKRLGIGQRIKNILWFLVFAAIFALILCVLITLVAVFPENFLLRGDSPCTLSGRCSSKSGLLFTDQQIPGDIESNGFKHFLSESQCIHRRYLSSDGYQYSEIIHDIGAKWSTIVNHDEKQCIFFKMQNIEFDGCPLEYPWSLDIRFGIPVCQTTLDTIAPIRRVMRHILERAVKNVTFAGLIASQLCSQYTNLIVDKVIVQYFDSSNRQIAKRSVMAVLEDEKKINPSIMSGEKKRENKKMIEPSEKSGRDDTEQYKYLPVKLELNDKAGDDRAAERPKRMIDILTKRGDDDPFSISKNQNNVKTSNLPERENEAIFPGTKKDSETNLNKINYGNERPDGIPRPIDYTKEKNRPIDKTESVSNTVEDNLVFGSLKNGAEGHWEMDLSVVNPAGLNFFKNTIKNVSDLGEAVGGVKRLIRDVEEADFSLGEKNKITKRSVKSKKGEKKTKPGSGKRKENAGDETKKEKHVDEKKKEKPGKEKKKEKQRGKN